MVPGEDPLRWQATGNTMVVTDQRCLLVPARNTRRRRRRPSRLEFEFEFEGVASQTAIAARVRHGSDRYRGDAIAAATATNPGRPSLLASARDSSSSISISIRRPCLGSVSADDAGPSSLLVHVSIHARANKTHHVRFVIVFFSHIKTTLAGL